MGETFVCLLNEWVFHFAEREQEKDCKKYSDLQAEVKRRMFCLCHRTCVLLSHIFQHSDGGHTGKCRPQCLIAT